MPYTPTGISWSRYRLVSILMTVFGLVPVVVFLAIGRQAFALAYLAIGASFLILTAPRYGFYLFMAANYVYAPFYTRFFAIHPGDVCALLFIGAVVISWIFRHSSRIGKTCFDFPLMALVAATVISGIFAFSPELSLVPIGRIIFIYLAYRGIYTFSESYDPARMVRFMIHLHAFVSLGHTILFFGRGGAWRIFGVTGVGFETFSLVLVPLTLAHAIWARTARQQLKYTGFFLVGLLAALATMSRGPVMTIAIACPILLAVSYYKARKLNHARATGYVSRFALAVVPILVFLLIGTNAYQLLGTRMEQLVAERATGTIETRLSLWKAALESFRLSPVTGIGIGNYWLLDDLLPHLKFDPVRFMVAGLSFHNVFLQYLSETGILGVSALLFLAGSVFSAGRRILVRVTDFEDMTLSLSVFVFSFIFCITIFYMRVWTWGQEGFILAFNLAILARWHKTTSDGDMTES
ncbi:MAG: O-antigen ligase family protein [Candidatus Zixiibacteriota bacterium]|nr:MAG: O-antigen ligase family protein [candidate division Zixibacteria bacterium]